MVGHVTLLKSTLTKVACFWPQIFHRTPESARPTHTVEYPECNLYVSGLPANMESAQLRDTFSRYGQTLNPQSYNHPHGGV